ncbi:DUF1501 domain-containing protein [Fimbriiglobus ruber]|uniref:DUF1501 domain-containing protein n=1 Tax=Fimbriiglobus ruber TaxID=1908690 RepID=A0A225DDI1_9BACT|nr:DUF1501 domain-containing protein [Fimbriiglobus ruber]OWK39043.1 hypothetical protein FRUB_06125 [Fimbriiglobus ruber]
MTRNFFCGSADHAISRRGFLGAAAAVGAATAADMTQLNVLSSPALAGEMKKKQKRVILLWLAGGASQLETWDPKPGASTGGPFRSIPTDVTGLHISELMPEMAKRMKTTCVIRGLNTRNGDHGSAAKLMMRGRKDEASVKYPDLGAVIAREMGRVESKVPDYVTFYTQTEGRGMAPGESGFLGARYSPMELTTNNMPEYIKKLDGINELDHQQRADLRELLSKQFNQGRTSTTLASHNEAYERVRGIMASDKLFDITQEPQKVRDRYGPTQFGEQTLIARRLVEASVPFVRVARAWWDSHGQNFETHQEMVPELDHVMATLIDDLKERGLLDDVMIVTLAEFGRTPQINSSLGRDHFAAAWSMTMTGGGIKAGSYHGKTDDKGNKVVDGEVNPASLFATLYSALGINPHKNYHVGARPIPLVEPGTEAVKDLIG